MNSNRRPAEYFRRIKAQVEEDLDRTGWPWDAQKSLLLDQAIKDLEEALELEYEQTHYVTTARIFSHGLDEPEEEGGP